MGSGKDRPAVPAGGRWAERSPEHPEVGPGRRHGGSQGKNSALAEEEEQPGAASGRVALAEAGCGVTAWVTIVREGEAGSMGAMGKQGRTPHHRLDAELPLPGHAGDTRVTGRHSDGPGGTRPLRGGLGPTGSAVWTAGRAGDGQLSPCRVPRVRQGTPPRGGCLRLAPGRRERRGQASPAVPAPGTDPAGLVPPATCRLLSQQLTQSHL